MVYGAVSSMTQNSLNLSNEKDAATIELRWYQTEAINAVFSFFRRRTGHPLVVVPTGGGKSVIIAEFLRIALQEWPDQKIVCLTHQKELVEQNEKHLLNVWPSAPAGVFSAGLKRKELRPITFASIQSIWRWAEILDFDLVLIDEAHLVPDRDRSMYRKFLAHVNKPVVGFTATPFRLGTGLLTDGDLFTHVAYDCNGHIDQLIREGYLSNLIAKDPGAQIDVEDVNIRAGEFVPQQVRAALDRSGITDQALEKSMAYRDLRKKWLVFAIDIEHAEYINNWLNEHGIKSAVVHSRMEDSRDEVIAGARRGDYQALVNVNTLTTGYDDPSIDMIVLLRPTASPVLHVQMLGRGLRVAPGKDNCLVLDFAGNVARLGPINNVRMGPKRKGEGNGDPITKTCPDCSSIIHAALKECPDCGHEFQFIEKINAVAAEENIIDLDAGYKQPEEILVDRVTYHRHVKNSTGNVTLKITYHCGFLEFSSWLSFKHQHIVDYWWKRRANTEPPKTVEEAVQRSGELAVPTHIVVDSNDRYPRIVNTKFNTAEEDNDIPF